MKNKFLIFSAALILACSVGICQKSGEILLESQMDQLENYLATADIVTVDKEVESGRTGGWDVVLEKDGVRRRARFKHVHKYRPHFLADSYQYEIAAYTLSRKLGLTIIPPLVSRQIDGIDGSLQIFVENCVRESDFRQRDQAPLDAERFEQSKAIVNIFEFLAGDECHDDEDTLIQSESWKICRIDFSEAFDPEKSMGPECKISGCSRHLYMRLKDLTKDSLVDWLAVYLNQNEMDSLWNRRNQIILRLDELIKTIGEEKVLFDY